MFFPPSNLRHKKRLTTEYQTPPDASKCSYLLPCMAIAPFASRHVARQRQQMPRLGEEDNTPSKSRAQIFLVFPRAFRWSSGSCHGRSCDLISCTAPTRALCRGLRLVSAMESNLWPSVLGPQFVWLTVWCLCLLVAVCLRACLSVGCLLASATPVPTSAAASVHLGAADQQFATQHTNHSNNRTTIC